MLDCYIDWVGLNGCVGAYETANSGQYITSLPGLNLKNINAIADDNQRTWRGVWDDVQQRSARKFYSDLRVGVNDCFQLNTDCDYIEDIFCKEENMELLTGAWMYLLGSEIMLERMYSDRLNFYTTFDRKAAEELKDLYQSEYKDELARAIKTLDTSACELCCGGGLESVVYYP